MFKHEKEYLHPVRVDRPNPNYAALLQEQLGGPQGELKSALQYLSQSMRIKDPEIKDLFLDVAAEELCHLEMVSACVNMLNGHDLDAMNATIGNVEAHVLTGLTPMLSMPAATCGPPPMSTKPETPRQTSSPISPPSSAPRWSTSTCTGRSTIKACGETIDFLLNREEAHNTMFREALQ